MKSVKLKNCFLALLVLFFQASAQHQHQAEYSPASGFALLGIARANAKANDRARAAQFHKEFLKVWENADKELPQFLEAEKWLK